MRKWLKTTKKKTRGWNVGNETVTGITCEKLFIILFSDLSEALLNAKMIQTALAVNQISLLSPFFSYYILKTLFIEHIENILLVLLVDVSY